MTKHKFRPAARILSSIGEDLIQDKTAAVVELVKNAYDADAEECKIMIDDKQIVISDTGHGMSYDDIVNKWLVPATKDKLTNKTTEKHRTKQGRKGIGRYAVAILGEKFTLITVRNGVKTTFQINWFDFNKLEFLDEFELDIETEKTNENSGTILRVELDNNSKWDDNDRKKLFNDLRRLVPPVIGNDNSRKDKKVLPFSIYLNGDKISPIDLLDAFDYKIRGKINSVGNLEMEYVDGLTQEKEQIIKFIDGDKRGFGDISFDLLVYDRERGSVVQSGKRLNLDYNEMKKYLDDFQGIGVYRNGFRIRPLGDPGSDWLDRGEIRVQNPSLRIGRNQIIGFVYIGSDEESGLIETSARDGLKKNSNYFNLVNLLNDEVIKELETRRFASRKSRGQSRSKKDIEFPRFESIKPTISKIINDESIDASTKESALEKEVGKFEENARDAFEKIETKLAIYQGQATLGRMINIVVHEGRRPIGYFRNQIGKNSQGQDNALPYYIKKYLETRDDEFKDKIHSIEDGIIVNADTLSNLFGRLDPLGTKRNSKPSDIIIREQIQNAIKTFESELKSKSISVVNNVNKDVRVHGWKVDILAIFTNLIDNSLYWLEKIKTDRTIEINCVGDSNRFTISYINNGPSIADNMLEDDLIFDPEFSDKPNGTGLGLAISGELAERNKMRLSAIKVDSGVMFQLTNDLGESDD